MSACQCCSSCYAYLCDCFNGVLLHVRVFLENSSFFSRFPFDDDSRRDLDFHLDRLAEEHPDIAEPLRNFREDKSSKKKRTEDCSSDRNSSSGNSTPVHTEKEVPRTQPPEDSSKEKRGLDAKLRYTVPDMRREQEEEQDRVGRSQSAPPSQQNPNDSQPNHHGQQAPPTREPVVRHIPIFVEGRDEPVIPKDFVDSPFPREKRNLSRETSPIPPVRRNIPEQHTRAQEQPTSIHVEHPPQAKHTSSVHINPQDRSVPVDIKINPEPANKQSGQQTQPPRQQAPPQHQPPPKQSSQPKLILGPLEKVNAVQEEIGNLMEKVDQFSGTSRQDKEYIVLDEMLTRNLLKLDDIETEGKEDVRAARKEAIRQIQRCISQLEAKAPVNDVSKTENQSTAVMLITEPEQTEGQASTDIQNESQENQTNETQSLQTESQSKPS